VLAAGAHSKGLAERLDARVPLESERGYHASLQGASLAPRIPIFSGENKYCVTPMEDGLRVAGTVELASVDAAPDYRRADLLAQGARRLFPDLTYTGVSRWMGHRPSLPDSLPVIGRAPACANAYFAFGHGHVGLTAAAPTGEIIGDLICGRAPTIDVRPYSAARFHP
jgi:D-amino-acid dehydrogenase